MDAITLDRLLAELRPLVSGRHLSRARLVSPRAVAFEVSGYRDRWLWLDASRRAAGLYLVPRELARRLAGTAENELPGRARHGLLHLRKHVDGARIGGLRRIAGERTVVIEAGESLLALRVAGPAPALSLVRAGEVLATLGEGAPAWPPPAEAGEREWDQLEPAEFAAQLAAPAGRSLVAAVLAVCPGLGPQLARTMDGTAETFRSLVDRLRSPEPALVAPGRPDTWRDADLATATVSILPIDVPSATGERWQAGSWLEAAAWFLEARLRGQAFAERHRAALERSRRALRRLEQLEANLAGDLAGLADEHALRRQAEALLAFGATLPAGAASVELADPWNPGERLLVSLDSRRNGLANAERLFERARRIERARLQVEARLRETRTALAEAREAESRVEAARDLRELVPPAERGETGEPARRGPRHYLTSRGLSILVGRGARENHQVTFQVARPEDLWFHVRDAPGAHVVLRDNEGRASAEDQREAAEVAAFFSEVRGSDLVDVHVTRRKHVRPSRGGPGRVSVAHSDTLRVHARDPEGRLRRR